MGPPGARRPHHQVRRTWEPPRTRRRPSSSTAPPSRPGSGFASAARRKVRSTSRPRGFAARSEVLGPRSSPSSTGVGNDSASATTPDAPRCSSITRRTRAASGAPWLPAGTERRSARSGNGRPRSDHHARARAGRSRWRAGRSVANLDLARVRGALAHGPGRGSSNPRIHGSRPRRSTAQGARVARPPDAREGEPHARRARALEVLGPKPGQRVVRAALEGAAHVLRLDQDLSPFYLRAAEDPDLAWATRGAGRMLRSPTVFEDVVKTVCTTNCAWSRRSGWWTRS